MLASAWCFTCCTDILATLDPDGGERGCFGIVDHANPPKASSKGVCLSVHGGLKVALISWPNQSPNGIIELGTVA